MKRRLRAERDLDELLRLGRRMDDRPTTLGGDTVGMRLAAKALRIRDREGVDRFLKANRAQREFERTRGKANVVLKARQMGVTSWVAGRFFLKTVTAPGVMTVQVAQTREAAEGIFRMVQRFWECLPEEWRDGPLRVSRMNAGQMVFRSWTASFA